MKRSHGATPLVPLDGLGNLSARRVGFQNRQPESGKRDWCRIEAKAKTDDAPATAEVFIYDEIGYWGTSAQSFIDQLSELDVETIDLHLNSPGGEVFDGVAIYNALQRHKASVKVIVDGLAASAASFIAQAGDEVVMTRAATMMIHDAATITWGNAEDLRKEAAVLDKISNTIADVYVARAGGTVEEWRGVMQAETWYNSTEAVEAGLADRVDGEGEDTTNKWDLSIFNHAGRDKAPSPDLIRQSVIQNRVKEKPVTSSISNSVPTVSGTGSPDAEPVPDVTTQERASQTPDVPASPDTSSVQNKGLSVLINGVVESDPSRVQAHINFLEGFVRETKESARTDFIDKLATDSKITAPMAEGFKALAGQLDDAQWELWKAPWDAAPKSSILAIHGRQDSQEGATPASATADRITVLEEQVTTHRQAGKSQEQIERLASWKELQALRAQQAATQQG